MSGRFRKYNCSKIFAVLPFLIFNFGNALSQGLPLPELVKKNDQLKEFINPNYKKTRQTLLLDSLKAKASKTIVTRKLYDLLIVSHNPNTTRNISESSDEGFVGFSGLRIRNIEIRRLNVFGTNIRNPLAEDQDRFEKLLNKTHINTNEQIIRKNLLFSVGDTISSLRLSDNERLLRQLPFIDDSRIIVIPVNEYEADIVVITKDLYSLGADFKYSGIGKGALSFFEKNTFGMGHEFQIEIPYNSDLPDSPGFGIRYNVNNIAGSFINLGTFWYYGLGKKTYGIELERRLISSETRYAGGVSVRQMFTTEDLDTLSEPVPLSYTLQDFWVSRSFIIGREPVTRIIAGVRYKNNNVFDRPFILPDSYQNLQKYKFILGALSYSRQKYFKSNLIYSYGRTEDIPQGMMATLTGGYEFGEFKHRQFAGLDLAAGRSFNKAGYLYLSAGVSSYFNHGVTEQGYFSAKSTFISNLIYAGRWKLRNFMRAEYTRGFDRNSEERLYFSTTDGFSGLRNDSSMAQQRVMVNFESVLFSPVDFYGFKAAFFVFGDAGYLFGTNEFISQGQIATSIGAGIRLRNDNLVFNTFQIRLGFYPNLPMYSRVNNIIFSGEQRLQPGTFDPGPPSIVSFR
jgi:hypothetical protein